MSLRIIKQPAFEPFLLFSFSLACIACNPPVKIGGGPLHISLYERKKPDQKQICSLMFYGFYLSGDTLSSDI